MKEPEPTDPAEPVTGEAVPPPRIVAYSPETTAAYATVIETGLRGSADDMLVALRHLATMVHCDFTGELRAPHTHPSRPQRTAVRERGYRYATISELRAGGLCLDSVGHILEIGHEMTCMCCGALGVVTKLETSPDRGWNFDGSQWVRTPKWIVKLREENLRRAKPHV